MGKEMKDDGLEKVVRHYEKELRRVAFWSWLWYEIKKLWRKV